MTAPRHHRSVANRHGAPLLVGLAVGAVLIGAAAVATPASTDPTLQAALGAPLTAQLAAAEPVRTPTAPTPPPRPTLTVPAPAPPVASQAAPTPAVPTPDVPTPTVATPKPAPTPVRTPQPAPEPTRAPAAPEGAPSGPVAAVLAATNAARAEAGCDDLRADSRLAQAAQGHAQDMSDNDYFSHTSRDGREFDDRIRDAGHPSPGGENIAAGQDTAAEVVEAWMNSEGHRRNILDCSFTALGVGYAPTGNYWVQNFGR